MPIDTFYGEKQGHHARNGRLDSTWPNRQAMEATERGAGGKKEFGFTGFGDNWWFFATAYSSTFNGCKTGSIWEVYGWPFVCSYVWALAWTRR